MLVVIWLHFIADFILQNDYMAHNKSTKIFVCLLHSLVYSLPFLIYGIVFWGIQFCTHFLVDFVSSKASHYLYDRNQRHWFFVTIGADQAIHLSILYQSWLMFCGD